MPLERLPKCSQNAPSLPTYWFSLVCASVERFYVFNWTADLDPVSPSAHYRGPLKGSVVPLSLEAVFRFPGASPVSLGFSLLC